MEENSPIPLNTYVNNTIKSFLPMLRCTSTIGKYKIHMDCMCGSFKFPTTSRKPSLSTREI